MAKEKEANTSEMEAAMETADFESGLANGLLHAMLDQIKLHPKPWTKMAEEEQRDVIAQLDNAAKHFCREAVALIRADGSTSIRGLLEKYTDKGDIVATIKISKIGPDGVINDPVSTLHHSVGKYVVLTPAGADQYMQGGDEPETMPDQPGLTFSADPDTPDEFEDVAL